jgi:predicted Fe-Mo cluster-binding NifX family protein
MAYKIAIASSDGESVNQHFGKAESFLIYEVFDGKVEFVEDREVSISTRETVYSKSHINNIIELVSDCKAVFAIRIGDHAARELFSRGIKAFSVDFSLNYIFTTLIKRQTGRVRVI